MTQTRDLDWGDTAHRRDPGIEHGRVTIEPSQIVVAGPEMRSGEPDVVIVVEHAIDTDGHDIAPQLAAWIAGQLPGLVLSEDGKSVLMAP